MIPTIVLPQDGPPSYQQMLCPQGQYSSASWSRSLTLKSEQKKVTANMVTHKFQNFPQVVAQVRLTLISKGKMEMTNSVSKEQKAKGLIPLTTKPGEIIWVHLDIVNNK